MPNIYKQKCKCYSNFSRLYNRRSCWSAVFGMQPWLEQSVRFILLDVRSETHQHPLDGAEYNECYNLSYDALIAYLAIFFFLNLSLHCM